MRDKLGNVARERADVVIVAGELDGDRQFRVELRRIFLLGRTEQFELQTATQPGLIDVGKQRLHLRLVRQLLEHFAEGFLDFGQLLAISLEIHRLLLLVQEGGTQLLFLVARACASSSSWFFQSNQYPANTMSRSRMSSAPSLGSTGQLPMSRGFSPLRSSNVMIVRSWAGRRRVERRGAPGLAPRRSLPWAARS